MASLIGSFRGFVFMSTVFELPPQISAMCINDTSNKKRKKMSIVKESASNILLHLIFMIMLSCIYNNACKILLFFKDELSSYL